jgi:hypothetical protein
MKTIIIPVEVIILGGKAESKAQWQIEARMERRSSGYEGAVYFGGAAAQNPGMAERLKQA